MPHLTADGARYRRSSRAGDQARRLGEMHEGHAIDGPVLASVDDRADVQGVGKPPEPPEVAQHRGVGRAGALDLEQAKAAMRLDGEVGLDAVLVAHVVEARPPAAVQPLAIEFDPKRDR